MRSDIVIFCDPAFPGAPAWAAAQAEALAAIGTVATAGSLAETLRLTQGGAFATLHAPYFPAEAWEALVGFLERGGGLVSAGGAPFRRPVVPDGNGWRVQAETTAYHRELRIHELLPVRSGARTVGHEASADLPLLAGCEALFDEAADTWNMVPHVTRASDLPHQMGSSGPMDARLHALLTAVDGDGRPIAAPVVLLDNTRGAFAGGRWLFVNRQLGGRFARLGGVEALRVWTAYCAGGVTELSLAPGYAAYELHERPTLTLQAQRLSRAGSVGASADAGGSMRPHGGAGDAVQADSRSLWQFDFEVVHEPSGRVAHAERVELQVGSELVVRRIPLPIELAPGLHRVSCVAVSDAGERRTLRQGFWGADEALLAAGQRVSAGRDYFERDGRPMPVVGMTYMGSDTARKFLFLPNASVWDRDMAHMRRAGINWIRTGIWTAYRHVMQVDGHASEEALRSIDAFVLTAARYGLQLTFTFFSFTPETWEGLNPYLDPRSVAAQKRFVRAIAGRYAEAKHIDWDLINEPSMFDPARIFADGPRSAQDPYERAAYAEWLERRHGRIETLRERWGMTPGELPDFRSVRAPEPEEINFDVQDMHRGKRGTRWLDYTLFSADMLNRWARQLSAAIKDVCPDHMVTVGQDEALGAQRPSPFFYGESVDYTTVHSWWLNDDLLWDGVFAKTADKPCLVQETGIMYAETPDGFAKRSEEELRAMLERKYAYAFAAGGAGAMQWIWNTNYYMDNANESHIGAIRADGTEKPETDVSYGFGAFMERTRDLYRGRALEEIAVVYPYSNDFSNRKLAFDATTRLVRVLGYELKMPLRGVSEYELAPLERDPAKLIVLPSAHNIDDEALARLIGIVERTGATLLLTGPAGLDAYWRRTERLNGLLGARRLSNVVREERLAIGGQTYAVSYGRRRIAEVAKEVPLEAAPPGSSGAAAGLTAMAPGAHGRAGEAADVLIEVSCGAGRLIWCPLPVELGEHDEALIALYRHAIEAAGCSRDLEWIAGGDLAGVYGRLLRFAEGALFIFISEHAYDAEIAVRDLSTGALYRFKLERERAVLFAADRSGSVACVYRPGEVRVEAEMA